MQQTTPRNAGAAKGPKKQGVLHCKAEENITDKKANDSNVAEYTTSGRMKYNRQKLKT